MSNKTSQSGFTLIELLIVVLIIGILASIAIPVFNGQRTKAKNSVAKSTLRNAVTAASTYMTETESHANTSVANLRKEDSSLQQGASSAPGNDANDKGIFVGQPTNLPANGGHGDDQGVVICVASKGDTVYCARQVRNGATYGAWEYKEAKIFRDATWDEPVV